MDCITEPFFAKNVCKVIKPYGSYQIPYISLHNFLPGNCLKLLLTLKKAFLGWWSRDSLSQSAAAAYCAIFSLPGFLIIVMSIAVMAFEKQQVETSILEHIHHILGADAASTLKIIIDKSQSGTSDIVPMAIGIGTLLFGATGLFVQLQKSLNAVWEVKVKKSAGLMTFLKHRITALGIMISLGFLLMVSLLLTATVTALSGWLARHFSDSFAYFFYGLNFILSLVTITFLFALIYKVLPDIHLKWPDALRGGLLAAILFTAGEYGLNVYFQIAQPGSAFGAAGSLILMLIWIFYSCMVLFFGAEFIRSHMENIKDEKPELTEIAKHAPLHKY